MADDLSLLFKIRGDSAGAKTAVAETRAAVATLRGALGSDFNAMQSASKNALAGIGDGLNVFVGQRIPLVGGAFIRVTENLRGFSGESKKTAGEIDKLNKSIQGLAKETGKTTGQLTSFLTKFVQLETQAKRDTAAIEFLGAAAASKLIPELEAAGAGMAKVAAGAGAATSAIAGMAIGIGVPLALLAALAAACAIASKQIFDLTKHAAEFKGNLHDLSQQLAVSVETLSALEVLVKTSGGNLGSLTASLGIFQRKLEEAQDPLSKTAAKFRDLNVDTADTETALRQTFTALAAMPEGFHQTATALELFGRGGKSLLAVLKEADGDLDQVINRMRELGILISGDAAKAADEFNDQLAIIGFQIRSLTGALASEAMPIVQQVLKEFSSTLKDNKEVITAVGVAIGGLALFLATKFREAMHGANIALGLAKVAWRQLTDVLNDAAKAYEAVRVAAQLAAGIPLPALLTRGADVGGEGSVSLIDTFEAQLQRRIQSQKELTGLQAAAADEAKRIGENAIKEATRQFEIGKTTRDQQLQATIVQLKASRDADLKHIEQQQQLKRDEIELAQKRSEDTTAAHNEFAALNGKKRAIEDEFIQKSKEATAKADADQLKATQEHNDALLHIFLEGSKSRIDAIQDELATGKTIRENAALQVDAIEAEQLRRRQETLEKQLALPQIEFAARKQLNDELERVSTERAERERRQIEDILKAATDAALEANERIKAIQDIDVSKKKADLTQEKLTNPAEIKRINDQIAALDVVRTENEQQQSARRAKIIQDEADIRAQILSGSLTTALEIGIATDKIRLASQEALTKAGIQSAGDTAKIISGIKHDAEIRDAEITKTDRLRRREEEIKQILEGANLEVEARKSVSDELAQISRDLASVEKRQVEDLIKARTAGALKAEQDIKKIQDDAFNERETNLRKRLSDPIDVTARQAVSDQLAALGVERTEAERKQAQRITEIRRDEDQVRTDIALAGAESALQIEDSRGAQQIAKIKAFVALRVQTEEDAEKEILAIRLASVNREIGDLRSQQTKTSTTTDPLERAKQLAALNEQIKIAIDKRTAIEAQGNRDVEEGRQKDLENERKYADELLTIRQRTAEARQQTDQLVIDALAFRRAPQSQIIAAQLRLDLANLKTRHEAIQKSIDKDKADTDERGRLLVSRIAMLEAAGQKETDVYQTAVKELAKANEKKKALHEEEEAELRRSEAEKEAIRRKARQDADAASPLGRIGLDIDDLADFAKTIEESIVPLNEILARSFLQVADAIGQTIQTWVLLGTTGPAVMRKILAQALASIAAEAAVNAIKELALGFAMLFLNPAESGAHFTAAALWGSIAGIAAVAGRGVAGDLFKPKTAESTDRGSTTAERRPELQPRDIDRNRFAVAPEPVIIRPVVNVTVTGQATEGFRYMVERVAVESVRGNGVMRKIQNGEPV